MKDCVVIYKTKYGTTKKYAQWISEELGCDLFEASSVQGDVLSNYKTIIFGGGLYASGIKGKALITKNYNNLRDKNIIVFTVGLADTTVIGQFDNIINTNFTEEMKNSIEFFHLRGGIDYKKLGFIHKIMMGMLIKITKRKSVNELTDENKMMIETYGEVVDFTDKSSITPIISKIRLL